MKIALVDDEQACLDQMAQLCNEFSLERQYQTETFTFQNGEAFLEALGRERFAMVFMDIYMDGLSGIEAARRLRIQDGACLLVFLTSSGEHMPEAFACHAFQYLPKPISRQDVFRVLEDALRVLPPEEKYIQLLSDRHTQQVFLSDLVSAATDAHYLDIHLSGAPGLRCRMTMTELRERIGDDSRFILVNKGVLVNAGYVADLSGGTCVLTNGDRFPVRIRNRQHIEQAVLDYNFDSMRRLQRRGRRNMP